MPSNPATHSLCSLKTKITKRVCGCQAMNSNEQGGWLPLGQELLKLGSLCGTCLHRKAKAGWIMQREVASAAATLHLDDQMHCSKDRARWQSRCWGGKWEPEKGKDMYGDKAPHEGQGNRIPPVFWIVNYLTKLYVNLKELKCSRAGEMSQCLEVCAV